MLLLDCDDFLLTSVEEKELKALEDRLLLLLLMTGCGHRGAEPVLMNNTEHTKAPRLTVCLSFSVSMF